MDDNEPLCLISFLSNYDLLFASVIGNNNSISQQIIVYITEYKTDIFKGTRYLAGFDVYLSKNNNQLGCCLLTICI